MTELTETARQEFRSALTKLADSVMDRPDAAEFMQRFVAGDAALVLTSQTLFAMPVEDADQALRDATRPADAAPDEPLGGFYL